MPCVAIFSNMAIRPALDEDALTLTGLIMQNFWATA